MFILKRRKIWSIGSCYTKISSYAIYKLYQVKSINYCLLKNLGLKEAVFININFLYKTLLTQIGLPATIGITMALTHGQDVMQFQNVNIEFFVYKRRVIMAKKTGMVLAAAVGALFVTSTFASSTTTTTTTDAGVKCAGTNACKGQSACKTANNACKGQNSCKGKGIEMVATEKDCTDKGGKVEAADKAS